ncbi:MAG: type II toxin-antitoxin system HicA family toxin [Candidatus Humimicrobiaceae bacterium]
MPTWKELKRFCEKDSWELYKSTDHYYYRKYMDDGILKITKASMGSEEIPKFLWKNILEKQLQVTQEYFNKIK